MVTNEVMSYERAHAQNDSRSHVLALLSAQADHPSGLAVVDLVQAVLAVGVWDPAAAARAQVHRAVCRLNGCP